MKLLIGLFFIVIPTVIHAEDDRYIVPEDDALTQGRALWIQTCETCHAYGIADAPIPMQSEEWDFRLKKGRDVLYEHAINGFIGLDYSMMPARGGDENLTDSEVRMAVDYMIFLARFYINKQSKN